MRVTEVWRYPVKSMQGERLDALEIGPTNIVGDRTWGVRDSVTGNVLTGRATRALLHAKARADGPDAVVVTLPDGRRLHSEDDQTDLALSSFLGQPVQLARATPSESGTFEAPMDFADDSSTPVQWASQAGTFNDGHPVHLLTDASLRGGAALHPQGEWEVRRFRPNVLIEAEGDAFPEDEWTKVTIGGVALEVYKRCTRCAMTSRAQPGLDDDLAIPRTLARNRKAKIGVYARVITPGTIAPGDDVTA